MAIKTKHVLEWIIFSFLGLVLLLTGSLFLYQNAYAGKIYNNVLIAGIDVSGKTKKQAETLINKKFDVYLSQDISFVAGAKSVSAKLDETGLGFDVEGSINQAYAIGRSNSFLPQLYASAISAIKDTRISVPVKIDNTKLNLFIAEKLPELNVTAANAKLEIQDGIIQIVPEVAGQSVDTSNLAADLSKLASSNNPVFTINLDVVISSPSISSSVLESQKAKAENYISTKINLTYAGQTYSPSPQDMTAWLVVSNNDDGTQTVALDDAAIKTYLTRIAKNFEVIKKDRRINALDNSVIEEGQQGTYLNKDKALSEIKTSIANRVNSNIALVTYTEDPKEVKVFPAEGITPGRYEGKYIDVDLSQQKLCRIEGNAVIDCFTISSGKASTPTPTGTRYIQSKEARRWSAPYGLWMPFWQALGGGYGIHELPEWPNGYKEGEAHLGIPVSHGCIRLGVGPAELVYNWTEIGTPVYIHK